MFNQIITAIVEVPEDTLQLTEPTNIFDYVTNLFWQSLKPLITDINIFGVGDTITFRLWSFCGVSYCLLSW